MLYFRQMLPLQSPCWHTWAGMVVVVEVFVTTVVVVAAIYLRTLGPLGVTVALGPVVLLGAGLGALGVPAVTVAPLGALLLLLALLAVAPLDERALLGAAGPHRGAALRTGLQLAAPLVPLAVPARVPGVAARLRTLLVVEPAVALLAVLHDLVAAEGAVALHEAVVLPLVHHRVQHRRDVLG